MAPFLLMERVCSTSLPCLVALVSIAVMLGGCSRTREASGVPGAIDHLVYAVDDLQRGMDQVEQLLGVRPILGGRHPDYGTHNALLSLGPATYLEIIAPDPGLPRPERGVLFELEGPKKARLATWAIRSEKIEESWKTARLAGLGLGRIRSGSRRKPNGTVLKWRLTDPYALPLGGAVPFLICWGDTPHPASAAPRAGQLLGLLIEHPQPERVQEALRVLGAKARVRFGSSFRLVAEIRTDNGDVELK